MGNRKPIIGVPSNVLMDDHKPFPGTERAYVNQDYLDALTLAGAMPVVLPMVFETEDLQAQLAFLDGVMFSGGVDLDPLTWTGTSFPWPAWPGRRACPSSASAAACR